MQQVGGQETNPIASGSSSASRLINQGKSSKQPPSEAVDRLTKQNKEEVRKRRETEQMLTKIEEDCRLFRQQHSVSATSSAAGGVKPRPQAPPLVPTENPQLHPRPPGSERESVRSAFGSESNASTDVGMQLLQVLRDATSNAGGTFSGGGTKLIEEYLDGHTMRTYYRSLQKPWDILPPETGPVKQYYKVRDANKDQSAGDRINFPVWRRRFIATVHATHMLISDKALAL
jgi:hypothetical protein